MKELYVDCRYGIAGDMMLSALIDLGADVEYIVEKLQALPIAPFTLQVVPKQEKGITVKYLKLDFSEEESSIAPQEALTFSHEEHSHPHIHSDHVSHHHHFHEQSHSHQPDLHSHGEHAHHHAKEILDMIAKSDLPERVKLRSTALFREIARAEGKIHGMPEDEVHFHEVGAMDSIIDIIGVCLALENLGIDQLTFAKPAIGYGMVKMAHGLYPVPAPATAEILVGVPLSDFRCEGELTTPTGAAFVKVLASSYDDVPQGVIEKIGYGAGTKVFSHPNVLRVFGLKK